MTKDSEAPAPTVLSDHGTPRPNRRTLDGFVVRMVNASLNTLRLEQRDINTTIAMLKERLLARLNGLTELGAHLSWAWSENNEVDRTNMVHFFTASNAFIRNAFPQDHPVRERWDTLEHNGDWLADAMGVLQAARDEIEGDWLPMLSGLIAGEVFDDFLDMAQHLSEEGYKAAAAVIAGSSLEAHLRRMCAARGIPAVTANPAGEAKPKRAEALNEDLARAKVYEKHEQKQVTAWLGMRNDAAHGHYENVRAEMVQLMIQGIRHFTQRHVA